MNYTSDVGDVAQFWRQLIGEIGWRIEDDNVGQVVTAPDGWILLISHSDNTTFVHCAFIQGDAGEQTMLDLSCRLWPKLSARFEIIEGSAPRDLKEYKLSEFDAFARHLAESYEIGRTVWVKMYGPEVRAATFKEAERLWFEKESLKRNSK